MFALVSTCIFKYEITALSDIVGDKLNREHRKNRRYQVAEERSETFLANGFSLLPQRIYRALARRNIHVEYLLRRYNTLQTQKYRELLVGVTAYLLRASTR